MIHLIYIYFWLVKGRKFLLKTSCSLLLAWGLNVPGLEANSLAPIPYGQPDYKIKFVNEWLYNYYEHPSHPEIKLTSAKLILLLDEFQRRKSRYNTEEQWLKYIFYQVHEKYLKHYQSFSTIPDLFERGSYNCVSGTALYALICELLCIPYAIRETEYHVYLLALVDGKKVLIESTDPVYGFVSQADTIQSLIKAYHEDGSSKYGINEPTGSTVDWIQLAGLQYFNKAVQFYNNKNFQDALSYLNRAMQFYNSARILMFKERILQLTASYSETQEALKR